MRDQFGIVVTGGRRGLRGGVEPGEVLPLLVDEVDHRERGAGGRGQEPRELVELRVRAVAQAELAKSLDPPRRLGVHGYKQVT